MALRTLFDRIHETVLGGRTAGSILETVKHTFTIPPRKFEDLTVPRAVRELLQNYVDEALAVRARGSGAEGKIHIARDTRNWLVRYQEGEGYSHDPLSFYNDSTKEFEDQGTEAPVIIGIKGTGLRNAWSRLEQSGISVVERSQDWVARSGIRDERGRKLLNVDVVEGLETTVSGSETRIYFGDELNRELDSTLRSPDLYFLYFREQRGWEPVHVNGGSEWWRAGYNSILDVTSEHGDIWLRGAYVTTPTKEGEEFLCSYNINTIREPLDDLRTRVDTAEVDEAVKGILYDCDNVDVIDELLRRGAVSSNFKEFGLLEEGGVDERLKSLWVERFNTMYSRPKMQSPVLGARAVTRTRKSYLGKIAEELNTPVVELNSKLTRFLKSCGVSGEADLKMHYDDVFQMLETKRVRGEGRVRQVDIPLRGQEKDEERVLDSVRMVYALVRYAEERGVQPRFDLCVEGEGLEHVKIFDFPERFSSITDAPKGYDARAVRKSLSAQRSDGEVPYYLPGDLRSSDFFNRVRGVRVRIPMPGGVPLELLGELHATNDVRVGSGSRVPPQMVNAIESINRLAISAVQKQRRVLIESSDYSSIAMRDVNQTGAGRNVLRTYVGLQHEREMEDSLSATILRTEVDLKDVLNVAYNLPFYVLAHRADYAPVLRTKECDIVSVNVSNFEQPELFFSGYKLVRGGRSGGEQRWSVFSYDFKNVDPLSSSNSLNKYAGVVRGAIEECDNKKITRKLLRAAADSNLQGKDLVEFKRYALDKDKQLLWREAFEEEFSNRGAYPVLASGNALENALTQARAGKRKVLRTRTDVFDLSHLVDGTTFGSVAESCGYRSIQLDERIKSTLQRCGVLTDIEGVKYDVEFHEVSDSNKGGGFGFGGGSGSGRGSPRKKQGDIRSILDKRELKAYDAIVELVGVVTEHLNAVGEDREYRVIVYDRVTSQDKTNGTDLTDYYAMAHSTKAEHDFRSKALAIRRNIHSGTPGIDAQTPVYDQNGREHMLYVRRDQLKKPLKEVLNNAIRIAVDRDAMEQITLPYLINTVIQERSPGLWKRLMGRT